MKRITKVEWIEHKFVTPPEEYTPHPTQEDYNAYTEALKKAEVKHQ